MSNKAVRELDPKVVWNHFTDINEVPRGSKKEEQIIQFMSDFGEKLGLKTIIDPVGNVIIKKPATPGMENRKTVVLQSHLDMVHQKNSDTIFDFETEGIKMKVDEDWVKTEGTTLGADNGLGVAAIMSVLSSKKLAHPAIEALFTIDEETGMTGAKGLEAGYLDGEILLNLDTEEDDEIDIGCAGGIDVTSEKKYQEAPLDSGYLACKISITGLQGGHSGMDIHRGFGNANKIMNQLFIASADIINICYIDGGGLRNAIPRESFSVVAVHKQDIDKFLSISQEVADKIKLQLNDVEPGLTVRIEKVATPLTSMLKSEQTTFIDAIDKALNGVYKMSPDMPDLVEASNNLARVIVDQGSIRVLCLTRSSVEKSKMEVANSLKQTFEMAGFTAKFSGDYPGWNPNPESPILKVLESIYTNLFKSKPSVVACHAGLECGILGTNYPEMDMISFGPTIRGAHSPDERASIPSMRRFWNFLQEILKNIPLKDS